MFIGVDNKAKEVTSIYIGVDGTAREVVRGYIGVDGKARLFYDAKRPASCTIIWHQADNEISTTITFTQGDTWNDLEDDNITIDAGTDEVYYKNYLLLNDYDVVKGSDQIIEDYVYYTENSFVPM